MLLSVAIGLLIFTPTMNDYNHPNSANLGVFVLLGIVPIVVYVITVLVLPWIGKGFK
jgi:hypothetical protein